MSGTYHQAEHLVADLHENILHVTMDNPRRKNALDDDAVAAFIATLERAQNDEAVRAVLLRGAGTDFCSGFDIVGRNAGEGDRPRIGAIQRRLPGQAHRLLPLLYRLQVPVVAAVRGYAVGIGLQLLMACDFVLAEPDAVLWEPFTQRGMTTDGGASWLLPRLIGLPRARQMLLLGRRVSGAEAADWGLVHECAAPAELDDAALALATRLAGGPTVALGLVRWLINTGAERGFDEQLTQEAFGMELASRSPDFREGLTAFVQKREPDFGGR